MYRSRVKPSRIHSMLLKQREALHRRQSRRSFWKRRAPRSHHVPKSCERIADRMRIAIISTVGDCSWAGSEEMWKLFAIEALRRGHSVAAALQTPIAQSQELVEFRALGGVVFAHDPLNRYTSRTVSR